jgi:hypothetical protein
MPSRRPSKRPVPQPTQALDAKRPIDWAASIKSDAGGFPAPSAAIAAIGAEAYFTGAGKRLVEAFILSSSPLGAVVKQGPSCRAIRARYLADRSAIALWRSDVGIPRSMLSLQAGAPSSPHATGVSRTDFVDRAFQRSKARNRQCLLDIEVRLDRAAVSEDYS